MRKINWHIPSTRQPTEQITEIPTFYGAIYPDHDDIPYYTEMIGIPEGQTVNDVQLQHPVFVQYDGDLPALPDTILPEFTIQTIRKKRFLQVSLPGIVRRGSTSSARLLTSFILEVSFSGQKKHLQAGLAWSGHSVLSQGKWVKVRVSESGIYKITYETLTAWGITDPAHPRVFGNGGAMVPEYNQEIQPDDPEEIPIRLMKGNDGVFNDGDYFLFYAQGPTIWKRDTVSGMFIHQDHLYSDSSFYFITSGTVKEIPAGEIPAGEANYQSDSWDELDYQEENIENLIKSGREWFEPVPVTEQTSFVFDFPDRIVTEAVKLSVRYICRSSTSSGFSTFINGTLAGTLTIPGVNMGSFTGDYAREGSASYEMVTGNNPVVTALDIQVNDPVSSRAWIDYVDVNVRSSLAFDGTPFIFRDVESVSPGRITTFRIATTQTNVHIWDITDLHQVKEMQTQVLDGSVSFTTQTDSLKAFIIFSEDGLHPAALQGTSIPNQDLHGSSATDMIIVTHPAFLEQANALADLHHTQDGLRVTVATTGQVYNEFSSGAPDAGAIRNFVRMFYDRATAAEDLPKYLLLFGDGSYDNLSRDPGNTNLIPTWQSKNSLSPTQSFVSDDFFGLLDETEGGSTGYVDIGIGRFPVNQEDEANHILDKIEQYTHPDARGDWRNVICFIGDDEDNNIHMEDADILATYLDDHYPSFHLDKIYLDAWPQEITSSGDRYPDVNRSINERVQQGSLIINYVGHGNERGLAHENILGLEDINSWENMPRLPLFVTATCEFSRFDDIENGSNGEIAPKTSAGEWVLLNPQGGGIGLLSTTRLVYSSPNFVLNQNFYKYIFTDGTSGKSNTLGDALRLTKNASGSGINKRNFTLLGDPALVLAYPRCRVVTDSLNHLPVGASEDTLKALDLIEISGHIENVEGDTLTSVNGVVYPMIYDKPRSITTLGNDGGPLMTFSVQDNVLFKGKSGIENGQFKVSFRIPKDIAYNPGHGRISYYAEFDTTDAAGSNEDIIVGGFSDQPILDNTGPEIALFMNDSLFANGGVTNADPILYARLSDENGINTVGNGIGHDMVAILDNDDPHPMVLNNYFEYALDSYQEGQIYFPLHNLPPGPHEIRLKAWDNVNNSSEATLSFVVSQESGDIVSLINYPNPFSDYTKITFTHTMTQELMEIEIRIYRFDGTLLRILRSSYTSTGFSSPPLYWDGKNENGNIVGAGIYLFRVIIRSENGETYSRTGKMIKIK